MGIFDALILGIIQGLTEFLPVSSSGHLVFFQHLLGYTEPQIAFDIVVHLGTLFAILIYFKNDILHLIRESFHFLLSFRKIENYDRYFYDHTHALIMGYIILTMIVTLAIALVFKDAIHIFFGSVHIVGSAWIVMGFVLLASRKIQTEYRRDFYQMTHRDAFFIGIAQGLALIPGISRSGTTIIGGMACGLKNKTAARFSFLVGLFAILGAAVFELEAGIEFLQEAPLALLIGFLSSALVGYLAIILVMKLVEKGKFFAFGFYCLAMGGLTWGLILLGKMS